MTPVQIHTLLRVYAIVDSPISKTGAGQCCDLGLLRPKDGVVVDRLMIGPNGPFGYTFRDREGEIGLLRSRTVELTECGRAMVQALLDLPLPECELHCETKDVFQVTKTGKTIPVGHSQETETVWIVPGTDFEYSEAEL